MGAEGEPVPETNPVEQLHKDVRVWSRRREAEIALRVYFDRSEQDGCTIYRIRQIEELG